VIIAVFKPNVRELWIMFVMEMGFLSGARCVTYFCLSMQFGMKICLYL
jgi:hypothetical protein